MERILIGLVAAATLAAACTGTGTSEGSEPSDGSSAGPVTIQVWHGQIDTAKESIDSLVEDFNATDSDIVVESVASAATADNMLPKVTTAMAAGTYPDIAYLYGSWAGNMATSEKSPTSPRTREDPALNWDDFWDAARQTVTVNDKVIGFPAIIDNLSVIYNKDLFDAAGEPYPSPDWTWDELRATAQRMTDPANSVYGVNYPVSGTEGTVWRFWPSCGRRGARC